jgi:hypothetical protein
MLVSCLAYSSTLKMEATLSSKRSDGFQRTVQCYIIFITTAGRTSYLTLIRG